MKKKQIQKNKKISSILIGISIILMLVALCISKSTPIRTMIYLISLLVMTKGIKYKKKKIKESVLLILILMVIYIVIDGIVVLTFKRIPIFSYNIVTTEKSRVYNSLGLRVWQCDKNDYKNVIVDTFYNKGYVCDADDIDPIPSNSFLNSVVENYDEYKNTYVKVVGKISKKNGQIMIEMQPYNTTDITINGYVTFADNITLRILFNQNEQKLDDYDIYDEITVVGIIKNMEQDHGKYVIYMYDTKISSSKNLNNYSLTAVTSNKCSLSDALYTSDKNIIYSYCLEDIVISFGGENQYELATALSSNKITVEGLYNGAKTKEENEEDESVIYRFDNYSVLVCDTNKSNKIIIGNSNLKFKNVDCN